MGIGISVFLIAVGAILAFAVDVAVSGLDLAVVGIILMAVGGLGLAFAMVALNGLRGPRSAVEDEYRSHDSGGEVDIDPTARRVHRRRTYID